MTAIGRIKTGLILSFKNQSQIQSMTAIGRIKANLNPVSEGIKMNRYEEIEIDGKTYLVSELIERIRDGETLLGVEQRDLDGMTGDQLKSYLQELRDKYNEKQKDTLQLRVEPKESEKDKDQSLKLPQTDKINTPEQIDKHVTCKQRDRKEDTDFTDTDFDRAVAKIEKAIEKGNVPDTPFKLLGYPETVLEFEGAAKTLISDARAWQRKAKNNEKCRKIFYPAKRNRVIAMSEVVNDKVV